MTVCLPKNCQLLSPDPEHGKSPIQNKFVGHYVIEASAGTGKTFTIAKIFFDLIIRGIRPSSILITTYTRDATAELKDRLHKEIREGLELYKESCDKQSACDQSPPSDDDDDDDNKAYWRIDKTKYAYLQECDKNFNTVTISTLDSLVHRILHENADLSLNCDNFEVTEKFQTNHAFQRFMADVVPKDEILLALISAYPTIERKKFTTLSEDAFSNDLSFRAELEKCARLNASPANHLNYEELGFSDFDDFVNSYRTWYDDFVKLVSELNDKEEEFIKYWNTYACPDASTTDAPAKTSSRNSSAKTKSKSTGTKEQNALDLSAIYLRLTLEHAHRNWVWFSDLLRNLPLAASHCPTSCNDAQKKNVSSRNGNKALQRLSTQRDERAERAKKSIENLKNVKAQRNSSSKCELFCALLNCLHSCQFSKSRILITYAVQPYLRCVDDDKQLKRIYEFNDFTKNLIQSTNSQTSDGASLVDAVKKRWECAIIDEFQDTNAAQWDFLRKFFLDDKHRLFLIGDPKQAIYGFRGCDIFVYRSAVNDIVNRQNSQNNVISRKLTLDMNFRSTPSMVETINALYRGNHLFWTEEKIEDDGYIDDNIADKLNCYTPVAAGHKSWHCIDKTTGKEVDSLVVSKISESTSKALSAWSERIVDIIEEDYLTKKICFYDENSETSHPVQSIYILCEKRKNLENLRKAFIARGIAFEDSKKNEKLFGAQESLDLLRIMFAIHNHEKNEYLAAALNTMFFGVPVYKIKEILALHDGRAKRKFKEWADMSNDCRKFSKLFDDILKTTRFRERLNVFSTTEAPYWRIRSLMERLATVAVYENMTWAQLLDYAVDAYWSEISDGEASDDDADSISVQNDLKIQMKTIHSCKGLQADVVFLLYPPGTKNNTLKTLVYHEKVDEQWTPLIDTESKSTDKSASALEESLERERLLYVAITRAKYRLHIPQYNKPNHPISLKLNQALDAFSCSKSDAPLALATPFALTRNDALSNKPAENTCDGSNDNQLDKDWTQRLISMTDEYDKKLAPPHPIPDRLKTKVGHNHSYSELKRRALGKNNVDDFILNIPQNAIPRDSVLPGGTNTGLFLHEALEKIDFQRVKRIRDKFDNCRRSPSDAESPFTMRFPPSSNESSDADLLGVEQLFSILNTKYKFSSNPSAVDAAKNIVYWTLTSEQHCIPNSEQALVLCEADKVISEMEFLTNCDGFTGVSGDYNETLDMFNGSIDCACRFGNQWFIFDWKSDKLSSYDDEYMRDHVLEKYGNQLAIYTSAFRKWLADVVPDNSQTFAGMIYVFLRGVKREGDSGFCMFPPAV